MKTVLNIGAVAALLLSLTGCQLIGQPSDEKLILRMLNTFEESLMAQDIDLVMSHYSEGYSDFRGMNKQTLRQILTTIKESGDLNDLKISTGEAKAVVNDEGIGTVGPMMVKTVQFNVTQTYTVVKEDGSWLISTVQSVQN
ncbi:MAG: hypothetical protein O7E57_06215 [Gammaproteobacteria bacterium]|nr:hypothetical protein [Gammaproteobacteria bacterium]